MYNKEQTQANSSGFLPLGTLLKNGTYRVEAAIASGGFGKTYVVSNTALNSKYAMKEFFHADLNDRDSNGKNVLTVSSKKPTYNNMKNSFLKEAQKIARLNHRNVIRVYDYFEENSTAYYVMDLIDGCSLQQKLDSSNHPLPNNVVRNYLSQLLDALEYIHSHGILHLDLKPSNIMLSNDGNIKLIDFGASKGFNADGSLSSDSKFVFTPGYAPIELRENNKNKIGTWTDFYSLGATIYKLVTNKKVPEFSDIDDYFKGITALYPFDFTGVEHDLRTLIQVCMNPSRAQRPSSVDVIRGIIASDNLKGNNNGNGQGNGNGQSYGLGQCIGRGGMRPPHYRPPQINHSKKSSSKLLIILLLLLLVGLLLYAILATRGCQQLNGNKDVLNNDSINYVDTTTIKTDSTTSAVTDNTQSHPSRISEWVNGRVVDDNNIEYLFDQPTNDQIDEWKANYHQLCSRLIDEMRAGFDISDDMIRNDPCLVYLIVSSKAIETQVEKQDWFNLYKKMSKEEIYKLYKLLYEEEFKRLNIDEKYKNKHN